MLIDWFTVAAEAINFLILVWLLKRYLFRPVLAAIEAREKKVAARIEEAAAKETRAQAAGVELRARSDSLEREREGLMRKAVDEAAAERQRLIELARHDAALLRSKLGETLASERAELGRQLSMRTRAEVFAVAHKALSDLAGASLEDRMIEVFIARLTGAGRIDAGAAGTALQAAPSRGALVRCAFEQSPAGRAKIEAAIRESLGTDISLRFETTPDLICGIELSVDGVKRAWSVSDYLSGLAAQTAAAAAAATDLAPAAGEAAHAH